MLENIANLKIYSVLRISCNQENSSSASFYGSKLENPSSGSKVTSISLRYKKEKKREYFPADDHFITTVIIWTAS